MTEERGETLSRRTLLKATAGAAGATALPGLAAGQSDAVDEWLSDAGNYDGSIADETGNDSVTVEVGADGNGGTFAFAPPAVRVDPGTTVTFTWVSNTHNVVVESQPDGAGWEGHETIENEGFEFESTFETKGAYLYFCDPHLSAGMKGAIVVGGGGGGGQQGGGGPYTRTVEMTDENVYVPESLEVLPGDTVVWENVGTAGHTITAYEDEIPEEADYWASGGFDSEEAARDGWQEKGLIEGGGSYEHTFETEGTHGYFCIPHETAGMVGEIVVTPDAAPPETEAPAAAAGPAIPEEAKAIGVAAAAAMASTLGLAYTFMKYGGASGRE
jgi:halocyanin-like protein